jgi:hypothetical protein
LILKASHLLLSKEGEVEKRKCFFSHFRFPIQFQAVAAAFLNGKCHFVVRDASSAIPKLMQKKFACAEFCSNRTKNHSQTLPTLF